MIVFHKKNKLNVSGRRLFRAIYILSYLHLIIQKDPIRLTVTIYKDQPTIKDLIGY